MNHFAVHLKLTQHCKSTILQLKKKDKEQSGKKRKGRHREPSGLLEEMKTFPMWNAVVVV